MPDRAVALTGLAHGGGCGCKLAPAVLRQLLADQPVLRTYERLLVGTETADDCAVWQGDERTCIVATTDFFTPIVDDPADFGRIAATNAMSDVYAMGARPLFALAILGMPVGKLPVAAVRAILDGGAAACAAAGIPVAGGHSIDAPEPIYGLAVIGSCRPGQVKRNSRAQAGDALILTKALGVGVYAAALRKGALDGAGYAELIASTTRLNDIGAALGDAADVHAMTDVTGFGLLGHALEIARGSKLRAVIDLPALPWLAAAEALARDGFATGASRRNWESYGAAAALPAGLPEWRRHLLTDPQTSGGLLVACAPHAADRILAAVRAAGFDRAARIGRLEAGPPGIVVAAA